VFDGACLNPIADMLMFSIKNIVFILMICFQIGRKWMPAVAEALSYLIVFFFFNFYVLIIE
jgi:hypothetical protein